VHALARPRPTATIPPGAPDLDPVDIALDTLQGDFRTRIEALESRLLSRALRDAGWNQTETARRLGMSLRTLVYKIRMHGIRRPESAKR
jgi:DNA-binding NtrC family response regulator